MLRVVHSLGGCGGTLLARCLGVLPNVVVLSEINPLSVCTFKELNPLYQDRQWLHLLSDGDHERFSRLDLRQAAHFGEVIAALQKQAESRGLHLIVRDYNYADFIGVPFVPRPPLRRLLYDALPGSGERLAVGLVRHPVDQFVSLRGHVAIRRGGLTAAEFARGYRAFVQDLQGTPVFRYEDLIASPQQELRRICECLQLPFDPGFQERFHTFDKVTGHRSRQESISGPCRKSPAEEVLLRFETDPALGALAQSLGYEEAVPGRPFARTAMPKPDSLLDLQQQVEELRRGAGEWMADIEAKEEEILATHAVARERLAELDEKDRLIARLHAQAADLRAQLERTAASRWRIPGRPWRLAETPSQKVD